MGLGFKIEVDPKSIKLAKKFDVLGSKESKRIIKKSLGKGAGAINKLSVLNLTGSKSGSGEFPVNIKTGFLRRSSYIVLPGQTITSGDLTVRAGELESIVGNSANYAGVVSTGIFTTRSGQQVSYAFGGRAFHEKALEDFGRERGLLKIMLEILNKKLKKLK